MDEEQNLTPLIEQAEEVVTPVLSDLDKRIQGAEQLVHKSTQAIAEIEKEKEEEKKSKEELIKAQNERKQGVAEWDARQLPEEEWTATTHAWDVVTGVGAGLLDTASSIITAPERLIDMMSGEMVNVDGELVDSRTGEAYDADWDNWLPFGWGDEDLRPNAKGTLGTLVQSATHFTSQAALIWVGPGGALSAAGNLTKLGALTKAGTSVAGLSGKALSAKVLGSSVVKHPHWWMNFTKFNTKQFVVNTMILGGANDAISAYSQEDNMLNVVRESFPISTQWMDDALGVDTWAATSENDHPLMMTTKNVGEQIGLGLIVVGSIPLAIFGGSRSMKALKRSKPLKNLIKANGGKLPKGDLTAISKRVAKADPEAAQALRKLAELENRINSDTNSKRKQTIELAKKEAKDGIEYGANKQYGSGLTDDWQANHTSIEDVGDTARRLKRIRHDSRYQYGSPGSVTNAARLAENASLNRTRTDAVIKDVLKSIKGNAYMTAQVAKVKSGKRTLGQVWGDSIKLVQEIGLGREAADQDPDQYMAALFEKGILWAKGGPGEQVIMQQKNIQAADLVISSLAREIRDLGIAGRQVAQWGDVGDIGGPADQLLAKFVGLVTETQRSKLLQDPKWLKAGYGDGASARLLNQELRARVDQTINSLSMAIDISKKSRNDDMFKSIFEVISMSDDLHNLQDIDNFIRSSLKGGNFKGHLNSAEWIKQLEGVMIHSILSGPKTPMRAIMGTSTATFLRPISQAVGAFWLGDTHTLKASLSSMNAMVQAIPEAWSLFKRRLNSYWGGEVSSFRSRYVEMSQKDIEWDMYANWVENSSSASAGDKAAFYIANMAREANSNNLLTYSTKIMAATDDAFGYILARAKSRERSVRTILEKSDRLLPDINPHTLRAMDNEFMKGMFDANGNIIDEALLHAKKEVTLTQDLTGFAKGLNDTFNAHPWMKPFFLFARTGINGLNLTAKHTPGFNLLVGEYNAIARATADNLEDVMKYGITNADELANAKALQRGRLAIGGSVISMGAIHFMNGGLTGNGPADPQKRQVWKDAGWHPRSINIGGTWVSYDSFEPFNQVLASIADIGDYSQLMGDEWTENQLGKLSLVIGKSITSKTYLSGLGQMVDLFSGSPGQQNRIIANIMNNTMPLAGLRNEIGKVLTPYTRELNSGIMDSIRNRNLGAEHLSSDKLPIKYDILNGRPLKDHNFPTRMFNMFSPVQFNLDHSPGRKFLMESGYDLKTTVYRAPDGTDLTDHPELRSDFQKLIGDQNLEAQLEKLAYNPVVIKSMQLMNESRRNGSRGDDPMKSYRHLKMIQALFKQAKAKAWAKMLQDPRTQELLREAKEQRSRQTLKYISTEPGYQDPLAPQNMYQGN